MPWRILGGERMKKVKNHCTRLGILMGQVFEAAASCLAHAAPRNYFCSTLGVSLGSGLILVSYEKGDENKKIKRVIICGLAR